MATAAIKRKSYRAIPKSGMWFEIKRSRKNDPANIAALACLMPKTKNSFILDLMELVNLIKILFTIFYLQCWLYREK